MNLRLNDFNLDTHLRRVMGDDGYLELVYLNDSETKRLRRYVIVEFHPMRDFNGLNWQRINYMQNKGYGVHYGLVPRNAALPMRWDEEDKKLKFQRGKTDNAYQANVVWCDVDNPDFNWRNLYLLPNVVISSGRGYHLYWYLKQPADISTDYKRACFAHEIRQIAMMLGADTNVADIHTRTLRLPGSINPKPGYAPGTRAECVLCMDERGFSTIHELARYLAQHVMHVVYVPPPPPAPPRKRLPLPSGARALPFWVEDYLTHGEAKGNRNKRLYQIAKDMIKYGHADKLYLCKQRAQLDGLPNVQIAATLRSARNSAKDESDNKPNPRQQMASKREQFRRTYD